MQVYLLMFLGIRVSRYYSNVASFFKWYATSPWRFVAKPPEWYYTKFNKWMKVG